MFYHNFVVNRGLVLFSALLYKKEKYGNQMVISSFNKFLIQKRMNIFVSNLSWGTTSDSLQELFATYGEVSSANVIKDRETGRSRGFGFVEMPNDDEAQSAIDSLNEKDFEGKTINVSVSKPKTDRGGSNGRYGHGQGQRRSGGYGGGNSYGRRAY